MTIKFYKGGVTLDIMRKISRRKINKIRALHKLGYSVRKIANELKCSPTTVQKYNPGDRNYELPVSNLFPEENLIKKTYTPASSQPTQGSYQPQVHHYYHSPADTSLFEQQRSHIDQENKRREQEKERLEQAKSDQRNWEQFQQLKMEYNSMKQEQKRHKRLKTLAARLKTLQGEMERVKDRLKIDNEFNKKMSVMAQEVKEEDIKKVQEEQQVKEIHPTVIDETMDKNGFNKQTGEEKPQKAEESSTDQTSIPAKQVEENETIASDHSESIVGIVLAGILGLCEGIDSYRPPGSKGSMNQSENGRRFNKYLKDDRKPERVNLILKR